MHVKVLDNAQAPLFARPGHIFEFIDLRDLNTLIDTNRIYGKSSIVITKKQSVHFI